MKTIKKILSLGVLVMTFLNVGLGRIGGVPAASAQNNNVLTQTITTPYTGGQCAVTQDILVYKGKNISLIDKFNGDADYLWIFDPVLTKVYYYNNGVLGGNPGFSWVSSAKFVGTTQNVVVMQSDSAINIIGNKSNRTILGGQFTYNIYRKYGYEGSNGVNHTEVREGGGSTTKNVKFNPYINSQNDYECQNIYVAFCGDGILDDGFNNYYIGDPSNFNSQHLNGGEQCDDGNNINGDGCSSTCKIEQPPQATCDSLTVTPIQGTAPLTVNYNCTATNATSYTINLIQNGNTTQIGTNPTGTYTITQPGYFQIQCVINGNITGPQCIQSVNVNPPSNIDLELDKQFADGTNANKTINSGDLAGFKLIVTNKGNTTATNFTVKDYLPPSMQFVSASNGGTFNAGVVTRTIASLAPNQSITLYFTGKVISASCQDENKAEVCDYEEGQEPQDPDSNPCNMNTIHEDDDDKVGYTCNPSEPEPYIDLELDKKFIDGTDAQKTFYFGDNIGFKIIVTNKGNTTATNFTVKDYFPTSLQFVSASNGGTVNGHTITWNIASLAPNQSITLYFTGKIVSSERSKNKAEVCDYEENGEPQDPDSDPCTMGPDGMPVEDDEDLVMRDVIDDPNDNPTCDSLTVTPIQGTAPLTVNYNCTATNATSYTINLIQNGNTTQIGTNPTGTYTITQPGYFQIQCVINGNITGPQCTQSVNVSTGGSTGGTSGIDLELTKEFIDGTTNGKTFHSGDLVGFKLIVTNKGNTTATNFTVKDYFPTSLQFVSASNGGTFNAGVVTRTVASLAPNQSLVLYLTGKVNTSSCQGWNKAEICDYEENGEPQDPDSDPCNMGNNMPSEDDEDVVDFVCQQEPPSTGTNDFDIEVDKQFADGTNGPKTFDLNDLIGFKIVVLNKGPATTTNFTVKDYLPAGLQFVSASNGGTLNGTTVTWNMAPLAAGQQTILYFTGRLIQNIGGVNKVEACEYKGKSDPNHPRDIDSDPCNMNIVHEDDDDQVEYTVGTPSSQSGCTNLSVTPTVGTGSLTSTINCTGTGGAFEIFVNGNLVSNNRFLNYTFTQPGNYTVLCKVGGQTSPACTKNVVVNNTGTTGVSPVSCEALTMSNNGNNNYTFNCQGNNASTYQINIYKDSISSSNLIHTISSQYGNYTFATGGHFVAQCIVDGNISYKLDIYNNKNITNQLCAYKTKTDNSLCAVRPTLQPYKITYVPPSDYQNLPTPIEYCTVAEQSSLACNSKTLTDYGLVKDHEACKVDLNISGTQQQNLDVGIVKSADKYAYTPSEYVTWTLKYTNHSNIAVSGIIITDTIPSGLTYIDSSNTPTSINGQTIIWDLGSTVTLNPGETRMITFRTRFDLTNTSGTISPGTYNYTNLVVISTPNDTNPNNNQSSATVTIYYNPSPFNYCGNRVVEIGEYCDQGPNGGTITAGIYKGRVCTSDCKLTDIKPTDVPKCADIDPPSINENEYLPYRWNLDLNKVSTTDTCDASNAGKIKSTFVCQFKLYNGKNGTTSPVKTWTSDCKINSGFDNKLMSFWTNKFKSNPYGRSVLLIDNNITNGIYGEYKIELARIVYQVCQGNQWVSTVSDDRLCQYNFVVAKPYLIQKGASTTTLQDNSLKGYYGFGSNTNNWEDLLKDVTRSLKLSSFNPTENLSYLLSSFVDKYDKLAKGGGGVTYKKVSGKNIYVYENSQTLSDKDVAPNSTIIIKNGDLKLEGTIADKAMYIVPNGSINIGGDANCSYYDTVAKPQTINGILIAGKGFNSDHYLNSDFARSRCSNGGLKVNGTLIGSNIDYIINKRRTVLDGWFESALPAKKTQHIIDGSSLNITPNINLWTSLPGADEVAQTLGVKKN